MGKHGIKEKTRVSISATITRDLFVCVRACVRACEIYAEETGIFFL